MTVAGHAWRMGALRGALALAGYWSVELPERYLDAPHGVGVKRYAVGEGVDVSAAVLVLEGALRVLEEPVGRRPVRLGALSRGVLLVPIGRYDTRPGVRLEAGEGLAARSLEEGELEAWAREDAELAVVLLGAIAGALEQQHWALRLAARGDPMSRLVALLLAVARDQGVSEEHGILLRGVPDAREMAALAGVSRESVVINLEWLVRTGVLRRREGRLWVANVEALRASGTAEP